MVMAPPRAEFPRCVSPYSGNGVALVVRARVSAGFPATDGRGDDRHHVTLCRLEAPNNDVPAIRESDQLSRPRDVGQADGGGLAVTDNELHEGGHDRLSKRQLGAYHRFDRRAGGHRMDAGDDDARAVLELDQLAGSGHGREPHCRLGVTAAVDYNTDREHTQVVGALPGSVEGSFLLGSGSAKSTLILSSWRRSSTLPR